MLRIVNGPTTATAYGLVRGKERTILVFDLGGNDSTCRCWRSTTRWSSPGFRWQPPRRATGTTGSSNGSSDKFKASAGIDLTKDKMAMQRLRERPEGKIERAQPEHLDQPALHHRRRRQDPLFIDGLAEHSLEFQKITQDLLTAPVRRSSR